MERKEYFVTYMILCLMTGAKGTTVPNQPSHDNDEATDDAVTEATLVTATLSILERQTHKTPVTMENHNIIITDAHSVITSSNDINATDYTEAITPNEDTEEGDEVEDVVDMDLPKLPAECSHVTDKERETGIFLGTGAECENKILFDYEDIFYDITSDECFTCRCRGLCPGMSESEIEAVYDAWVAAIGDKVIWNQWTITYMTMFCTTMFIGTIGNILVLITVIKIFRPVSVTNMFIASLATADFLVSSAVVPFRAYLLTQSGFWQMSAELCKTLYYCYYAFFMASVFSLTAMSLERFFVICYPMKAQYMSTPRRAKVILAIVWPLAFSLALPVFFQTDKLRGECRTRRDPFADDDWSGPLYIYITAAIFVTPACIIGYSYIRTSLALLASIKKAKGMTNEKNEDKKKESKDVRSRIAVIRMLIAVWVVFMLCWAPYLTVISIDINATEWFRDRMPPKYHNHFLPLLEVITFGNSALNPVLYAFMSRKFRRGFIKCFLCCLDVARTKSSTSDSSSGFSRTRATTAITSVAATVK